MIGQNTDIRYVNDIHQIADCIITGTYGDAPEALIRQYASLPKNQLGDYLRILAVPFLFHKTEAIFKSGENPIPQFIGALEQLSHSVSESVNNQAILHLLDNVFEDPSQQDFDEEIKNHTGQHYGNLFKEFNGSSYFDETVKLLKGRLEANDIRLEGMENMTLLDQGCGGGRYTIAWKMLGVKKATGIDFSDIGLEDAGFRAAAAGISGVEFVKGSVLEMPFEDNSFDIVYSNGVLHHTNDWQKGISEQLRVMKPGGFGWQYLIEAPGGIFWDSIEILRAILKDVNKKMAQDVLKSLGIPMNRVFYMLDHVMVPVNTRLTPEMIVSELEKHGAINIKRLERGIHFDRIEAINNNIPFATEKFGVGENRFIFSKA